MRISFIGSGNVGTHLAQAFYAAGHEIVDIYSRDVSRAMRLADGIGANGISDLLKLNTGTDAVILAVRDDVIYSIFHRIRPAFTDKLILHTAGSVSVDVFGDHPACGVLWPVQTLSSAHPIDMREVPVAVSSNSLNNSLMIESLARTVSDHVYLIDDFQRAYLHLAATFANNFTNHMYAVAHRIAGMHHIPTDILYPLIRQTAAKVGYMSPEDAQTGAAVRDDLTTISRHLRMLEDSPDLQELYGMITKSIQVARQTDKLSS